MTRGVKTVKDFTQSVKWVYRYLMIVYAPHNLHSDNPQVFESGGRGGTPPYSPTPGAHTIKGG